MGALLHAERKNGGPNGPRTLARLIFDGTVAGCAPSLAGRACENSNDVAVVDQREVMLEIGWVQDIVPRVI